MNTSPAACAKPAGMMHLRAALGSMTMAVAALTLGACDNPQENCRNVAKKYDVCAPKLIEQSLAKLPEQFRIAADMANEAQAEKIKTTVAELNATCDAANFSDAEKRQFRIWRACVKKECSEFTKCITGKNESPKSAPSP